MSIPSDLAPSAVAPDHGPDALVRFRCPSCGGSLNLRRKHFGVEGRCVHCASPVKAVDGPDGPELISSEKGFEEGAPGASESALPPGEPLPQSPDWGMSEAYSPPWEARPAEAELPSSSFATGTAGGGAGFAQALFGTSVEADAAPVRPTSLFAGNGISGPAFAPSPFAPVGVAGAAPAGDAAPASPAEPVVFDGDGRPMKAMTEAEKESFAAGLHLVNSRGRKPGRWLKRLKRAAIVAAALAGAGFAASALVPGETREKWKEQVLEWLEPGMVVADYLPFDLPWQEPKAEGKVPVYRQAFEGLDQLKDGMNAHLEQASENLESAFEN